MGIVGLASSCKTRPKFIQQFTFNVQFTFSCNSFVHNPILGLWRKKWWDKNLDKLPIQ